jgi:hypothetical protein
VYSDGRAHHAARFFAWHALHASGPSASSRLAAPLLCSLDYLDLRAAQGPSSVAALGAEFALFRASYKATAAVGANNGAQTTGSLQGRTITVPTAAATEVEVDQSTTTSEDLVAKLVTEAPKSNFDPLISLLSQKGFFILDSYHILQNSVAKILLMLLDCFHLITFHLIMKVTRTALGISQHLKAKWLK